MSPTLQLLPSQLDSMSDHDFVFPTFLFETFRLFRCSLIQCLKGTLGSTRKWNPHPTRSGFLCKLSSTLKTNIGWQIHVVLKTNPIRNSTMLLNHISQGTIITTTNFHKITTRTIHTLKNFNNIIMSTLQLLHNRFHLIILERTGQWENAGLWRLQSQSIIYNITWQIWWTFQSWITWAWLAVAELGPTVTSQPSCTSWTSAGSGCSLLTSFLVTASVVDA